MMEITICYENKRSLYLEKHRRGERPVSKVVLASTELILCKGSFPSPYA